MRKLKGRMRESKLFDTRIYPVVRLPQSHTYIHVVEVLTKSIASRPLKVIGCSSLRGGGGELGKLKTLTSSSNLFAQNVNYIMLSRCATTVHLV